MKCKVYRKGERKESGRKLEPKLDGFLITLDAKNVVGCLRIETRELAVHMDSVQMVDGRTYFVIEVDD